jgi:hypothetical protein
MDLLPQVLIPLLIIGGFVYLFIRRNRERAGNAPLRGEIEAQVCFETSLDRASILGTGGFGGTRGVWIRLRGPKRLIVGTDAFMVSAPQALRDFVFRGSESTIAFGQAVNPDDCIMITGQAGGRQVQLAITGDNLPDIWRALAATGATLVLRAVACCCCCQFAEVPEPGRIFHACCSSCRCATTWLCARYSVTMLRYGMSMPPSKGRLASALPTSMNTGRQRPAWYRRSWQRQG